MCKNNTELISLHTLVFILCITLKQTSVLSFYAPISKLQCPPSNLLNVHHMTPSNHQEHDNNRDNPNNRRNYLKSIGSSFMLTFGIPGLSFGEDTVYSMADSTNTAEVVLTGELRKLFDEGRVMETQGRVQAAARIYTKVTNIAPNFIYGWSSLGNTQVVSGSLSSAEISYTKAIDLCRENLKTDQQLGVKRCDDLYVLLLNRGAVRLNSDKPKEALEDLDQSSDLRGKPDVNIAQNRARARELNSRYALADRDYDMAISMTSNEVAPFWLRASLVKFQLGDTIGALDLLRRVEVKFPEAPEVRAALAAMIWKKGDEIKARQKFLEIPDRARLNFSDRTYLGKTVSWPPAMIDAVTIVARAVGDIQN